MAVEFRQMRYFVVVAEERNFGLAARRLGVTQAAVRRPVRELEEAVGAELFERRTRPIRLTEAGAAFLEEARVLLDRRRRVIDRSRRVARGEQGYLSVAALRWVYGETLSLVLGTFGARFPDVGFELSIRETADQVEAVSKRWVDVGFTRPVIETEAVRVEPLLEQRMVAVVPEGHALAGQAEIGLDELVSEPFVTISDEVAPGFDFQQASELSRRSLTPGVVHVVGDPASQLALVAGGIGVGLHLSAAGRRRERGVAFVPLAGEAPAVPLALVWRREDERAVVRAFLDAARELAAMGRE